MHAAAIAIIHITLDFIPKNLLPGITFRRLGPVRNLIAADDQHDRARPFAQDARQRTHEAVIAAIRFKITIDKSEYFVAWAKGFPRQREHRRGIGAHGLRVDAIEHHADSITIRARHRAMLKIRRSNTPIHALQREQQAGVFYPHARVVADVGHGKLGIKIHIASARGVKKLQQRQQLRIRPHVLEKQALAPAGIGDNHIRRVAGVFHAQRRRRACVTAYQLGFKVGGQRMYVAARSARDRVTHHRNMRQARALKRQRTHIVARVRQRGRKVLELPREILMHEQQIHKALAVTIIKHRNYLF